MSKFSGLFDESKPKPKRVGKRSTPAKKRAVKKAGPRRGRPAGPAGGKRSDPAFVAITAYVRRDALPKVKARLLDEGRGRDMSDLVQEAFDEYLKG